MKISLRKHLPLATIALGVVLGLGACGVAGDADLGDDDRAALAARAGAPGPGDLDVSIAATRGSFSAGEAVALDVTFINRSQRAVRLLAWQAVADDLEEDLFRVAHADQAVAFTGPHYKRPTPTDADFVVLRPGASLTRPVDLTAFYDLARTGLYAIRYETELAGPAAQPFKLASNDVTVWIEGRAATSPDELGSLTYNKCTTTQIGTVQQAVGAASTMTNGASAYLANSPSATPRYTTWFGSFSTSGWSTARSHFTSIKDAIDTRPLSFDCGCKKRYYAYVYANQPYKVYLCSVFWSAPLTGTDSKGGTLVHEISHFDVVANTDDYAYGQTNAKALASSDPGKALSNADNHEYFAETR